MHTPGSVRALARAGALPTLLLLAGGCALFGRSEGSLPDHMESHWTQVGQVQTALVFGDLEGAREPARWLAEHPEHPDLPQGVMSPVEDMRAFARSVVRAGSVADASRCAAEMGAACGRCHQASGSGPLVRQNTMPETGAAPQKHMARHLWAADRLWEGLVAPSEEAWRLGADALAEDPLFVDMGDHASTEVMTLARQVHALGATARNTQPDHRAGVYARLMVSCAQCHALVGVGVVAPGR